MIIYIKKERKRHSEDKVFITISGDYKIHHMKLDKWKQVNR